MVAECVKKKLTQPSQPKNLIRRSSGYILGKGGVEVKWFNNLYTQKSSFNNEWNMIRENNRSSYYTSIVEILYGFGDQFNAGIDIFFKTVKINGRNKSPLEAFNFQRNNNSHFAFTGIFPKVKVAPIRSFQNLTIETGVFVPTANDPEGNNHNHPYLAADQFEWWTEVFYVNDFARDFQLFAELDGYWRFGDKGLTTENSAFNTPAKLFLSYFPIDRVSVYFMTEFNPSWETSGLAAAYYQNGLGIKYQLTNFLEIEALYTDFTAGKNQGAGQTFNLGVRLQK